MTVHTYAEFLSALDEMGFLLFGGSAGLVKLSDITPPELWFHGGEDDPWGWRKRLCEERDGVYVRLLGGQTFLISWEWYPKFLAAYRTCGTIPERYESGEVNAAFWRMRNLFEERRVLGKHDLTKEFGRSPAERGLAFLQREMYITISGEVQKLSVDMKPVGWPSMEFSLVEDWAPEALSASAELDPDEMRREIRKRAGEISPDADPLALDKLFG